MTTISFRHASELIGYYTHPALLLNLEEKPRRDVRKSGSFLLPLQYACLAQDLLHPGRRTQPLLPILKVPRNGQRVGIVHKAQHNRCNGDSDGRRERRAASVDGPLLGILFARRYGLAERADPVARPNGGVEAGDVAVAVRRIDADHVARLVQLCRPEDTLVAALVAGGGEHD